MNNLTATFGPYRFPYVAGMDYRLLEESVIQLVQHDLEKAKVELQQRPAETTFRLESHRAPKPAEPVALPPPTAVEVADAPKAIEPALLPPPRLSKVTLAKLKREKYATRLADPWEGLQPGQSRVEELGDGVVLHHSIVRRGNGTVYKRTRTLLPETRAALSKGVSLAKAQRRLEKTGLARVSMPTPPPVHAASLLLDAVQAEIANMNKPSERGEAKRAREEARGAQAKATFSALERWMVKQGFTREAKGRSPHIKWTNREGRVVVLPNTHGSNTPGSTEQASKNNWMYAIRSLEKAGFSRELIRAEVGWLI